MKTLKNPDEAALIQFKNFLFKQKEEFVRLYHQSGKVFIHVQLSFEVVHLKDNFGYIIFHDFKDYLSDKFLYEDLERLKVEFRGILDNEMFISLDRE